MIAYVVLGVALIAGLILLLKGTQGVNPQQVVRVAGWTLGVIAVVVLLVLIVTGKFNVVAEALLFGLPVVFVARRVARGMKGLRGPAAGQTSDIETRMLRMTLDHDSGALNGTVLEGRFQGRLVEELSQAELLELLHECRVEDPESATIVETFLDRNFGAEWREAEAGGASGYGPSPAGAMTPEEALEVLGLEPGATAEDIKEAHHRLMLKMHPDQGGSTYLAAKINQAKDLLLAG